MLSKGQRATQRAALKAPRCISTNSGSAWCRVQGAPARERCDACCLCDLRERAHAPLGTTSEPTESGCAAEGLRADAQGEREETVGGGRRSLASHMHSSPPRNSRTTYYGANSKRNAAPAPRDAYAPMRWRVSGQVAVREEESSVYGAAFLSLRGSVARLSLASQGC